GGGAGLEELPPVDDRVAHVTPLERSIGSTYDRCHNPVNYPCPRRLLRRQDFDRLDTRRPEAGDRAREHRDSHHHGDRQRDRGGIRGPDAEPERAQPPALTRGQAKTTRPAEPPL